MGVVFPTRVGTSAEPSSRASDAEADASLFSDSTGLFAQLLAGLATCVLVEVLVERGAIDEAERALEPFVSDLQRSSLSAATLRFVRGRLLFAQRRFAEALVDFRGVGDIVAATSAVGPCFQPWRSAAALTALALGELDTADDLVLKRSSWRALSMRRALLVWRSGRPVS